MSPWLVIAIILTSVLFRAVDLGSTGLWGDEETTSLPSLSLAQGEGNVVPSGMEYRRALLHTYTVALSARAFDVDRDYSYRIPSVVIGIATVLLMFVGTRHFFGPAIAIIVTALVALSEWHILLSRTARMYGPVLFFTMAFVFSAMAWLQNGKLKHLAVAMSSFLIAGSLHLLAIVALPVLVLPALFGKQDHRKLLQGAGLATALGAYAILYDALYVSVPYASFVRSEMRQVMSEAETGNTGPLYDALSGLPLQWPLLVLVAIGLALAVWLVRTTRPLIHPADNLMRYLATVAIGSSLALSSVFGHAYGVLLSTIMLLLIASPIDYNRLAHLWKPAVAAFLFLTAWFVYRVIDAGFTEGIKASLRYPFPYLLYQATEYPGVILFFLIGVADSVFGPPQRHHKLITVLSLAFLIPVYALGVIMEWAPDRYLLPVYPLVLIVASSGLLACCTWLAHRLPVKGLRCPALLGLLLVASGLLGAHGLPQAITHSPTSYGSKTTGMDVYPDHRAPGCYVRAHLQPSDIVVAEDALQQHWYVGRVDYWLRNPAGHTFYSYLDENGHQRDIYVSSQITTDDVIEGLTTNFTTRIWVITSGETRSQPEYYLPKGTPQHAWLDSVMREHDARLYGRDGLSAVYCLNCEPHNVDESPWHYDCR